MDICLADFDGLSDAMEEACVEDALGAPSRKGTSGCLSRTEGGESEEDVYVDRP